MERYVEPPDPKLHIPQQPLEHISSALLVIVGMLPSAERAADSVEVCNATYAIEQ